MRCTRPARAVTGKGGSGKGSKGKKTGPAPKLLSASKVSVNVLNGSGVQGIAGTTATALSARGFHILSTSGATTASGAPDYSYTTPVVEYSGPADLAAAQTVAAQLKSSKLLQVSSLTAGAVTLIVGIGLQGTRAAAFAAGGQPDRQVRRIPRQHEPVQGVRNGIYQRWMIRPWTWQP